MGFEPAILFLKLCR